jgi:hypothetical protein
MHAVARGETGSAIEFAGEFVCAGPNPGLTGAPEFSETLGGFESSFFHIRHLDIENGIFEAAYRRAGWELRL